MSLGNRQEFSNVTKGVTYAAQHGRCAICGKETPRSQGVFDHIIPDAINGANSRANCTFQCHPCDAAKTKADQRRIAKMKRQTKATNEHDDVMASRAPGDRAPRKGTIRHQGFRKKQLPRELRQPPPRMSEIARRYMGDVR